MTSINFKQHVEIILVTGANAGIGFELTRLLAEKGHTVYLGARREASGKEAAEKLHEEGLKTVKPIVIDVTKLDTIKAAKETIENAEGHLDVLVNNAGIARFDADQNATTIDINTNLFGNIQTSQTFLPLLRKSPNGVIANVSTDMASNSYMAGPEGVLHQGRHELVLIALAHELKKDNIKVNLVTPGYTSTKLNFHGQGGKSTDGPTGLFVDWNGKEFPW
ncbi:hypothetical protein BJ912DRAFT_981842 [Pholiota molesta]|nr:hypothetical protein BJ912DRAFT_981842 [Pholiota molesta]